MRRWRLIKHVSRIGELLPVAGSQKAWIEARNWRTPGGQLPQPKAFGRSSAAVAQLSIDGGVRVGDLSRSSASLG